MVAALLGLTFLLPGNGAHPSPTPGPDVRLEVGDKLFEIATKKDADREAITHAIVGGLGPVRACWTRELTAHPKLSGQTVFVFTVLPDGSVSRPVVKQDDVRDETLADCAGKALHGIHVPLEDQTIRVVAPIRFEFGASAVKSDGPPSAPEGMEGIEQQLAITERAVIGCWANETKRDPGLAGTLEMTFTIEADGSVRTATASGGSMPSLRVKTCVVGLFKHTKFPAPSGGRTPMSRSYLFPPKSGK